MPQLLVYPIFPHVGTYLILGTITGFYLRFVGGDPNRMKRSVFIRNLWDSGGSEISRIKCGKSFED